MSDNTISTTVSSNVATNNSSEKMNLPAFSIKNHVLTYMLSLVLILFGLISYERIGVDRMPEIEFPMLSVSTILPGGDPSIIDASITNIVESAVNGISGIDDIQSSSLAGVSVVMVRFDLNKNIDIAFNEMQAKVNEIIRLLPNGVETPIVKKVEIGGAPIMWLSLEGDRTLQQLNLYAKNVIKKRLETISGVGNVLIAGERERTLRVNLNIQQMSGLGVTVEDVINAFNREHIKMPGGFTIAANQEQQLKLDLEFHSIDQLKKLIVGYQENLPVFLQEVANVEDGLEDFRRFASYNGKPTVGLGLVKISGANTVAIVDEAKKRLNEEILPQLPDGINLNIVVDDGNLITAIIDGLKEHLFEGTLLAGVVVLLFLMNMRSTLIVITAIPVSLLGAVAAIYFAGFTFNTMTMLGLLLLIGVVVDDAIVVLENIFQKMEQDPNADPATVAIEGTSQVMFAILAATFTLVSLFGAVIFMDGIMGRFISSFAVVVVCGVIISLFVSVTLTPMLCAKYLRVQKKHGRVYQSLNNAFNKMERFYLSTLKFSINNRLLIIALTAVMVYSSGWFMGQLGKGFLPEEDKGRFVVSLKTPLGSNINYTLDRLKRIESILQKHEEIRGLFSTIGTGDKGQVNQGAIYVNLIPRDQRSLHQTEIIEKVRIDLAKVPGVKVFAAPIPAVGGQRGEPLQFILKGPNLEKVAELSTLLTTHLEKIPVIGTLDSNLQLDMPELEVVPLREKAREVGLDSATITNALRVLVGGFDVAKYNDIPGDGERYDIRLKMSDTGLSSNNLQQIYLRNNQGQLVRLDSVTEFKTSIGPATIGRFNLQYAATFYATPKIPEGDAAVIVLEEASKILPNGYQIELIGRAKEFSKTAKHIMFAFVTGLILIYMTLASQFNSFIQPLIVMMAQPLAIIGGIAGLWIGGHSLNIYSMIGLVLLVGLVAKNSILLIDLTNQMRAEGKPINQALLDACPRRLRPVLMTSLTVIFSMFPAALGLGAGADINAPLAVAVIGGMISSTLLTLVVVPAVYSLVESGLDKLAEMKVRIKRVV